MTGNTAMCYLLSVKRADPKSSDHRENSVFLVAMWDDKC